MRLTLFHSKREDQRAQQYRDLAQQMHDATAVIEALQRQNEHFLLPEVLAHTELGQSLQSLKIHLDHVAQEEKQRHWTSNGLAIFSDILRNKQSMDFKNLANEILSQLVRYLEVNQGALFILEGDTDQSSHLNLVACYAYSRTKHLTKRVETGEGMVGQCVLEKQPIYLTQVPRDYVHITSGLGEATPSCVLISPLLINDDVFGVIEIASLHVLEPYKREFMIKLSENIAATIRTVKENDRNITLLRSSQQQSEELKAQEEELRQNMEELEATQEEMRRKSIQLAAAMAETQSLVTGINETMATIEFSPDGKILAANAKFLHTMQYTESQIVGKHHRMFVPDDVLASADYANFWARLASGVCNSGIFRRLASDGRSVWLNAVYNPIKDETGRVLKVIKLATDITSEQELLAANKALVHGIDASMAVIEFSPAGVVLDANENFLTIMGYTIGQIKGSHHRTFMPAGKTDNDEYRDFWNRLARGEAIKGVFERVASSGEPVFVNAIYNPIFNADGKVIKVTKFATNITQYLKHVRD